MKFSINYNTHSSAMRPGSRVWLEGSGSGGRLGTAAGDLLGKAGRDGEPSYSAVVGLWRLTNQPCFAKGPRHTDVGQQSQERKVGR